MPGNFAFQQMAGTRAPMVGGMPYQHTTGFEGLPFASGGSSMGAQLLQTMLIQPVLANMMGQAGYMPLGLHDQNSFDLMQKVRFTQAHQQALSQAAARDRDMYLQTFRGVAHMFGQPFGADQRKAAMFLADTMSSMSPALAPIMPNLLDQLGGLTGSNAVMAHYMMMGGRYRLDPVTGQMGMSAKSVGDMSRRMFDRMFRRGELQRMRGLTAGQAGQMFDELTRRGMLGSILPSQATREIRSIGRDKLIRAIHRRAQEDPTFGVAKVDPRNPLEGLSASQLDSLRLDPNVADRLRAFDARRVARQLRQYADAVSAVRDIFGDMGQPNAPMQQLMGALQSLSQGTMHQYNPTQLGHIVRTTYNLAQQTGLGMDAAMGIQQHAAMRAMGLGMNPAFGINAAQGAMAYNAAMRQTGILATPAWGAMNLEQMTQLDTNLRISAANSSLANRLGTIMRVRRAVGGFDQDSELASIAAAVESGQDFYLDAAGNKKSLNISSTRLRQLLTSDVAKDLDGHALNMSGSDVNRMVSQIELNREQINRFGIGGIVRGMQREADVMPFVNTQVRRALTNQLVGAGMGRSDARRLAGQVGGRVTSALFDLPSEVIDDPGRRTDAISRIIRQGLADTEAAGVVGDLETFSELGAEMIHGETNRAIRNSSFRSYKNMTNLLRSHSSEVQKQAQRNELQASLTARVQQSLSHMSRGGVLRRAVSFLQGTDLESATLEDFLSTTFGGVDKKTVREALRRPLGDVYNKIKELEQTKARIMSIPPGAERSKLMEEFTAQQRDLQKFANQVLLTAEQQGVFVGDDIAVDDVYKTINRHRILRTRMGSDAMEELREANDDEKWNSFWSSSKGEEFRELSQAALDQADDIVVRSLHSDEMTMRLGPKGLERVESMQRASQTLRELAAKYTGGDVDRVLAGDLGSGVGAEERARIMKLARSQQASLQRGLGWYRDAIEDGIEGWNKLGLTGSDIKTLRGFSKNQRLLGKTAEFGISMRELMATGAGDKFTLSDQELEDRLRRAGYEGDPAGIIAARAMQKNYGVALDEIAERTGSSREEILDAGSRFDQFDKRVQKFRQNQMMSGREMIEEFHKAFGYGDRLVSGKDDSYLQALVEATGTGSTREFVRRGILTQKRLLDFAKRADLGGGNQGIDILVQKYKELGPKGFADWYRNRVGEDVSDTDLALLRDALGFQSSTGLLSFGEGEGRTKGYADMLRVVQGLETGGRIEKDNRETDNKTGTRKLEIEGVVEVVGLGKGKFTGTGRDRTGGS